MEKVKKRSSWFFRTGLKVYRKDLIDETNVAVHYHLTLNCHILTRPATFTNVPSVWQLTKCWASCRMMSLQSVVNVNCCSLWLPDRTSNLCPFAVLGPWEQRCSRVSKLYHTYLLHTIDEVDPWQLSSSQAAEPGWPDQICRTRTSDFSVGNGDPYAVARSKTLTVRAALVKWEQGHRPDTTESNSWSFSSLVFFLQMFAVSICSFEKIGTGIQLTKW